MAIKSTKQRREADNNDSVSEGGTPAPEDTKTGSDTNVEPGEPVAADKSDAIENGAGVKDAGVDPNQNDDNSDDDGDDDQGGTSAESRRERDSAEDPSNVGDSVTHRTNDGATGLSNDGATGDNNNGEANTKAGDAPVGVKSDRRVVDTPDSPSTVGEAMVQSLTPAAALNGPRTTQAITEHVTKMLREFDGNNEETPVSPTTNIFDAGLLERANIVDFGKKVEDAFDIDLSVSEVQNWLLARDVVNSVLRKVAKD